MDQEHFVAEPKKKYVRTTEQRAADLVRRKELHRKRAASDPEYTAQINAKERARYHGNPNRKQQVKDRVRIRMADPAAREAKTIYDWERRIREKFGLTPDEYDAMLARQGGCCALCKTPYQPGYRKSRRWCIDHDHDTGAVRGLLCTKCNTAIAFIGDKLESVQAWLKEAVVYLGGENASSG